jgi:energy-coupling factor transport system permease protein
LRTSLAYVPRRAPLQQARAPAALAYLGAFPLAAFIFSSPLVLVGALAGACAAGLAAGARRALVTALGWGLTLAVLIIVVNGLVAGRGVTVLVRGPELPLLGPVDITLEALAEGGVLALRILVALVAFAVYSACVDPDRVLRMLAPVAHRSALTATLIARMVPLAAADLGRLREAAALRGPAAAPAGRAALVRRLVAASLDRAWDVAATLELRGYGRAGRPSGAESLPGSRRDRRFVAAGMAAMIATIVVRAAVGTGFDAYPRIAIDADPALLTLAFALPALALAPFLSRSPRYARGVSPAESLP